MIAFLLAFSIIIPFILIVSLVIYHIENRSIICKTNIFAVKKEDSKLHIVQWFSFRRFTYLFKLLILRKLEKSNQVIFKNELYNLFDILTPDVEYTTSTHLIRVFQTAERKHLLTYTSVKIKKKNIWLEVLFFRGLPAAFKELKKKRKRQFYLITFYKK